MAPDDIMIASTQTNHPIAGVNNDAATDAKPLETAINRLRSSGLRITQPRIAILETMLRFGQPASIEQIHNDLADSSCDLVTVYRCLAVFEELGLVRRSFFHNGTSLYEINLSDTSRYHVICKATNRVEEIDAATTAELREMVQKIEEKLKARGYTDVSHMVEFFGVSPQAIRAAADLTAAPFSRQAAPVPSAK
jgi:Fur family transcriptional regulator, ferric uptake regulator